MQRKYCVFECKFAFVNFSLLFQCPRFYFPTSQAPFLPFPHPRTILHLIFALNQLLIFFFQRCSPKMEVAIDKPSMCEVSQGSFAFQEEKLSSCGKEHFPAFCKLSLVKAPACKANPFLPRALPHVEGPQRKQTCLQMQASEGHPLSGCSSRGACTHTSAFNHCSHRPPSALEDTTLLKAQFTPFFFSQRLKIALSSMTSII